MKKKKISIILNCYNGQQYLAEALKSVEKQTYKNWELIFWDNQSKDKSKKILKSFKNKKFKYYKSKKHTTLYAARNLAIQKAKGKFIGFIDADDIWDKDKLKVQIKYFQNKDVALVYGNQWIKKESNNKRKKFINYKIKQGYVYQELIKNYNIGILTCLIKRKYLGKSNNIFNDKYNMIGDYDLFLRLSKNHKFAATQKPIATYRIHKNNLSIKNKQKQINEFRHWLNTNRKHLNYSEYQAVEKKILHLQFINLKLSSSFTETVIFFSSSIKYIWSIKNILIVILPKFFLKKYMWFS